jgi:hypothetical protein
MALNECMNQSMMLYRDLVLIHLQLSLSQRAERKREREREKENLAGRLQGALLNW